MTYELGSLHCDDTHRHRPHVWTYTDPATGLSEDARCDGTPIRDEQPQPCCGDPLCPCATKPGWTTTGTGSMNYPDLQPQPFTRKQRRTP